MTRGVKAAFVPRAIPPRTPSEPLGEDGNNSVCARVCLCMCMYVNVSTGGKYTVGASGVRPKECVELDQEESTQSTSLHKVNNIGATIVHIEAE